MNISVVVEPIDIKEEVVRHFKNLYSSRLVAKLRYWHVDVTSLFEHFALLLKDLCLEEEVTEAIFNCDGNKAPRPDGFNFNFFKAQWLMIKGEVMAFLEKLYETGSFYNRINSSFVTFIPKCKNLTALNKYRPISLVRIFCKVVAKVLANGLRLVIGKMVGPNQFAFIKGR